MDPPRSSDQGGVDQNTVGAGDNGAVSNQIGDLTEKIETSQLDTNREVKEIKEGVTKLQEQMQVMVEEMRKMQAYLATLTKADANSEGQNQELVEEIGPMQADANPEGQNQERVEEIGPMQAADVAGDLQARIERFVRDINDLVIENGRFTDREMLQTLVERIISDIDELSDPPFEDYDNQLTIVRLNDIYSFDLHAIRRQETTSPRGFNDLRRRYPHCEILIILRQCPNPISIFNKIRRRFGANFLGNWCDFQLNGCTEKHLVMLSLHYYFLLKYGLTIPEFVLPL